MIEINKHYDEDEIVEKSMSPATKNALKYSIGGLVVLVMLVLVVVLFSRDNVTDFAIEGTTTVAPETIDYETDLIRSLSTDQQNCTPDRGEQKRWTLSVATLVCETAEVDKLAYAKFETQLDLDDTFNQQASSLLEVVENNGGVVSANVSGTQPCETNDNESGAWGVQGENSDGGKFICISTPSPKILWTHNDSKVLGEADINTGNIEELIQWWIQKAGPR